MHLCSTLCTIALRYVSSSSYLITKISSTMPKTFGMSLNISSIFCWNMLPTGAAPNRSGMYLYLPNWQANVVRYNDFSSTLKLWYPELAYIIDKYLTLFRLGSISFNVGPQCIGFINAWFNHAGSRHSLTLPLALGTNTKLLHHSAVSSTPSGVIISICCNWSNSSLNSFVTHMLHILVVLDMACYQV